MERLTSGTPWETRVGYSRAVRAGDTIHIAGTTAGDAEGKIVGGQCAFDQTVEILAKLERYLNALGGKRGDVVRTRIYLANIKDWEEVGRAHAGFFADAYPTTTILQVGAFVDPAMLVEIEAEAVLE